jgi:hypothetical protein
MVAFAAATASAKTSGAHFFSASGSVADNGALQVSWDEAGVGQSTVTYTLHAQSSATYACINGGGNHPSAANKQSVNGPLSSPSTGFNPTNGRVQVTNGISVGPLPSTLTCPGGQTFVLACVSYTGITLTDTTNNVTADIADVSRTFVKIQGC